MNSKEKPEEVIVIQPALPPPKHKVSEPELNSYDIKGVSADKFRYAVNDYWKTENEAKIQALYPWGVAFPDEWVGVVQERLTKDVNMLKAQRIIDYSILA